MFTSISCGSPNLTSPESHSTRSTPGWTHPIQIPLSRSIFSRSTYSASNGISASTPQWLDTTSAGTPQQQSYAQNPPKLLQRCISYSNLISFGVTDIPYHAVANPTSHALPTTTPSYPSLPPRNRRHSQIPMSTVPPSLLNAPQPNNPNTASDPPPTVASPIQ
ncbi:hypothetical protein BDP27DRAFT_1425718 [Rhodocollybia butyracea]|uniref:Uncharacterized protein n=1 Tax=Rhodocollybia butyracea TaxID=206335 RepID=A0A9P5PIS1_9AGAR|nr:hypothetical protein BDP27DRAFT_1425718 [Rhodocollybia butyracea]